MDLTGRQTLSFPIEQVRAALNEPAILQKCIFGCAIFEEIETNQYRIVVPVMVGHMKAEVLGTLTLSEDIPPTTYK